MATKELTVKLGQHDSTSYKNVEVEGNNLSLKGSSLVITNDKVSYFNGKVCNSKLEEIGNFQYRTKEYNPADHPGMEDNLSFNMNKGEYFSLSAEALELILASIVKFESDYQTTINV